MILIGQYNVISYDRARCLEWAHALGSLMASTISTLAQSTTSEAAGASCTHEPATGSLKPSRETKGPQHLHPVGPKPYLRQPLCAFY